MATLLVGSHFVLCCTFQMINIPQAAYYMTNAVTCIQTLITTVHSDTNTHPIIALVNLVPCSPWESVGNWKWMAREKQMVIKVVRVCVAHPVIVSVWSMAVVLWHINGIYHQAYSIKQLT